LFHYRNGLGHKLANYKLVAKLNVIILIEVSIAPLTAADSQTLMHRRNIGPTSLFEYA